jgi:hypothetical protein
MTCCSTPSRSPRYVGARTPSIAVEDRQLPDTSDNDDSHFSSWWRGPSADSGHAGGSRRQVSLKRLQSPLTTRPSHRRSTPAPSQACDIKGNTHDCPRSSHSHPIFRLGFAQGVGCRTRASARGPSQTNERFPQKHRENPHSYLSHNALPTLDFVIEEWPRLQAKWETWAYAATDADVARQVPFKSRFVGNAGLPAWQIVMHVVNHGTLHRGQIVGMLRQLGVKPPATDIVFYYYEQAAAAAARLATGSPAS